ncbi:MAG: Gldg family protein [Pseudomonadales bacterium]
MNLQAKLLLLGITAAFLLFTMVNESLFDGIRLDLTENGLYTLSPGTREVIGEIDEPINFYFFFSESLSRDLTSLRGYADQVQALLQEYELEADGKIRLQVIDPEPFSEDEDLAAKFGLQSVPVGAAGDELYFGLAATNALDQEVVIPFFQPDKEAFLEYDLSRTIQTLNSVELPKIALMSSLKIDGDVDMQTFQSTPPWMVVEQLQQRYQLESLPMSATEIPVGTSLLVLVHPKNLSPETLYAIDQFALDGGRLLVFLDPFAEMEQTGNPMVAQMPGAPSDLATLLDSWGIAMPMEQIVADADLGLQVGSASGAPVRHIGILGLTGEQFSADDITISGVSSINVSSAGKLEITEERPGLEITPLISVGPYAATMPTIRMQTMSDPEELLKDFTPDEQVHHLALRLTGEMQSAFTDSEMAGENHIASSERFNAVVVADTDILSDRLWVQVQNFFGQRLASPFAGNGDFIFNLVDNLGGSSALITIRSRGQYSRPFEVVQDLRRQAEAQYLESANALQAQLLETETRLAELSSGQEEDGLLSITPEQEAELQRFQEDKLRIRKQLRDVRHQLDKDIEGLGSTLKFLNILLIPVLLTLALMMLNYLRLSSGNQPKEADHVSG